MFRPSSILLIATFSGILAACSSGGTSASVRGGSAATGGATLTDGEVTGGAIGNGGTAGMGDQNTGGVGSGGEIGNSGNGNDASGAGGITGGSAGANSTGGRTSGGVAGGRTSGSAGGTFGSGTAGRTSGGAGGTAGNAAGGAKILWSDSIQSKVAPWGLDGYGTEYPIGTTVAPDDANGANFSLVPDPLGGSGSAIRHFATFDTGGSRSQGGIYSDVNTIFGKQAKTPEGVWIAQEWYFPQAIGANGDAYCWINLWDFHSVDSNRGNRWHTSPGLMLAQDGSMKVTWTWGGTAYNINKESARSSVAMPVGRWFDIEIHYVWSDTPTATITLWIDGQLAIEQSGVQTRATSHQIVETYLKFYGSTQGRGPWTPTPSLKYTRNMRIAGERIWR
jgi:hypothetical protein